MGRIQKKKSALIIAQPGQLRVSLQVLLKAIPYLEAVDLADNAPAAVALSAHYEPSLVLLELNSADYQTAATLGQLKLKWPHSQYIVLVDDEQGEQLALSTRAEAVLIKGVPPARLLAIIERLLLQ